MRNVRYFIFVIIGLWALVGLSRADKFPMPNLKGQSKEGGQSSSPMELQADEISFNAQQEITARGHVYLDTDDEQVIAQQINYNFHNQTGVFHDARIFAYPYQDKGQTIAKVSAAHMVMQNSYMTTCDLDEPHFRIASRRMDVYQKDRVVMRAMRIYVGKVPVFYFPYFSHTLNRPLFTFQPGATKDFGYFLLTKTRMALGPHVKLSVHLDSYERSGFGYGLDIKYDTPNFGQGLWTAYYTFENKIGFRHRFTKKEKEPKIHHERSRIRWRHRWQIDKRTNLILQIYKIHDFDITNQDGKGFIQNYFRQETYQNPDVNNYMLLTHVMPHGTLTFNMTNSRINRQLPNVDRLPEINYTMNAREIGNTGFYLESNNTYSNLSLHTFPKTSIEKTERMDTLNALSHPFRVWFIALNPHVGGENTYYSRTVSLQRRDIIRGAFITSLDISTRFYRLWRYVHTNVGGLNINGLRHVITPTMKYTYQAKPTPLATSLNQIDGIDNLYRIHQIQFGIQNQLQTKRQGKIVDLLRILVSMNFGLPTTTGRRGYNPWGTTTDFNPTDWLTLHNESEYDSKFDYFNFDNVSMFIHAANWSVGITNLWSHSLNDQQSIACSYRINPKWMISTYDTIRLTKSRGGGLYSQAEINASLNPSGITAGSSLLTARGHQFTITRDLHEWQMDFTIETLSKQGLGFYFIFHLKAFPSMKLNVNGYTFFVPKPVRPPS